ncbi:hypothetical protein [Nocardia sp. NPDC127526]|uniref:hypothetical protein n=1 Tax=Nocardia sp. NPDC127526 TaxID=3345393 RepID=UPI003633B935
MTEHGRLRLALACAVAAVLGIGAGTGVGLRWDDWTGTANSHVPRTNSPLLMYGLCGERRTPDPSVRPVTVGDPSTAMGTPIRERQVELRAQRHPEYGWIAWAELVSSTSELDMLWLDWTYQPEREDDDSLWRNCSQPVTAGRATPAVQVFDDQGRSRWFMACGQAPPQDRGPRSSGVFCTKGWNRPN